MYAVPAQAGSGRHPAGRRRWKGHDTTPDVVDSNCGVGAALSASGSNHPRPFGGSGTDTSMLSAAALIRGLNNRLAWARPTPEKPQAAC